MHLIHDFSLKTYHLKGLKSVTVPLSDLHTPKSNLVKKLCIKHIETLKIYFLYKNF